MARIVFTLDVDGDNLPSLDVIDRAASYMVRRVMEVVEDELRGNDVTIEVTEACYKVEP